MSDLKSQARTVVGTLAGWVMPGLKAEVRAGDVSGANRRLKRLIAHAEFQRLSRTGNGIDVQKALTARWQSDQMPVSYYDMFADRFEAMFDGAHRPIRAWLAEFADSRDVSHVIEVGCGDGRALVQLADATPKIPRWTGVDIHAEIIARNRAAHAGRDGIEFIAADATDWLADHAGPGVVLMTYGGVMEYIAPQTISGWFKTLADKGGAGVLLVEPVDPDHDFDNDPDSHIYGGEDSFSHNHRALLRDAGYRVVRAETVSACGYTWVMMLAEAAG